MSDPSDLGPDSGSTAPVRSVAASSSPEAPTTTSLSESVADHPQEHLDGPLVPPPTLPLLASGLMSAPESAPRSAKRRLPEWLVRLLIVGFACGLYLPNIGSFGLWDPWETHYGEVTRYMIETGDWVHPWWGYKGEKIGTENGPGEQFHSKPILLFWMEAATIKAIGLSETSIRFPVALIAIIAIFATYYALSKMVGRRRALLASLVLATCPLWYFLARQSQTDMPFVGTLTAAMMFFALAMFGPREPTSDRRFWVLLGGTLIFILALFIPQLGIITADVNHAPLPRADGRPPGAFDQWRVTGWMLAATYLLIFGAFLLSIIAPIARELASGSLSDRFKEDWRRKCYLWIFYGFCALSLMGKGLLGFMLPGAVIFVYLLLTNEWGVLLQRVPASLDPNGRGGLRGRAELLRGIGLFICIGFPWYVALLSGPDGNAFWTRFFIHDHFNRLGSGVHSIDDGSFEHFLKWLGFGMWPWSGLILVGLAGLATLKLRDHDGRSRLRLFLYLWAFLAYMLFSASSTKFHHYIFPALPPLAVLIGLGLADTFTDRSLTRRALVIAGIGISSLLAWDLFHNPQHLRNQFTYKYDREWPSEAQRPHDPNGEIRFEKDVKTAWEPDRTWAQSDFYKHTPESLHTILAATPLRFETWIPAVAVSAAIAFMLLAFGHLGVRTAGLTLLGLTSTAMAAWVLNYYMPMIAPHWSQKYLFDKYFDVCIPARNPADVDEAFRPLISDNESLVAFFEPRGKRNCQDEVISWLLTWRGESFYSDNTIRPIQKDATQFEPYLEEFNKGARFYVHIERTRARGFKSRADTVLKKLQGKREFKGIKEYAVTLEHNENYWFVLLKAEPVCQDDYDKDQLGRCLARVAAR